jgi:dolichol kinase
VLVFLVCAALLVCLLAPLTFAGHIAAATLISAFALLIALAVSGFASRDNVAIPFQVCLSPSGSRAPPVKF